MARLEALGDAVAEGLGTGDAEGEGEGLLTGLLAGDIEAVGLLELVQAAANRARPETTATVTVLTLIFRGAQCRAKRKKFTILPSKLAGKTD